MTCISMLNLTFIENKTSIGNVGHHFIFDFSQCLQFGGKGCP